MDTDAIEPLCQKYERTLSALKHLQRELSGYKKRMSQLRTSGLWDEYQRVRMDADILAQSIAVTQREIERYEAKLADEFVDHKPFPSPSDPAHSY